jgi:acetolactate synthase-1/2/3 large subunit
VRRSTVADVVVDGLKRAGTPRLFGVAGGDTSHPLLAAARAGALPLTFASGETAAGVMAAVTGDLLEAPGAVFLGSRESVSAAAGVAHALASRAPMVLLTGDEHPTDALACKASVGLTPASAAHWIAHATRLAATVPRGPVHVGVPTEVALQPSLPLATSCRPDPLPPPDGDVLDAVARRLAAASRPLLVAGLHCRSTGAQPWVRALVEALPAPMLVTWRAKGALPDPHPLVLGLLGDDGFDAPLVERADLVVALGLDALETPGGPWWSTVPVLALGPPQGPGHRVPRLEAAGEIAAILEELAPRLRDLRRADWDVAELDRLKRGRSMVELGQARARRRIVRRAREATPAGAIVAVDAGPYSMDVAIAWDTVAPREFLMADRSAAGPFALSAAIATHLVHPERWVVCFTGTDGVASAANELESVARIGAPIVVVVFDDAASGVGDLLRLAESARVTACAEASEARFSEAMSRALHARGPSLIAVPPP